MKKMYIQDKTSPHTGIVNRNVKKAWEEVPMQHRALPQLCCRSQMQHGINPQPWKLPHAKRIAKKKKRTGDPKPKLQHLKATEAMRLEHRAKELAAQWVVWVSDSARKEPTGNVLCKSTVSQLKKQTIDHILLFPLLVFRKEWRFYPNYLPLS